ncbi:tRNA lysidine(34) synthetase TilS [Metamycoplasma equirhinis]|uniref:tRNA lysidine(34) synthetase TilS n=1 Tax=Metamycoplasma equirhinis TaxID=92402 RepID=UPI0035940585
MNNEFEELIDVFKKHSIDIEQKILIGVSGGPDSMWLLNLMKDKNIVVAHVNYNKRIDSNYDQALVKNFCLENNIPCEILSLHSDYQIGNFQSIARNERYEFYSEIYKKYSCTLLLLAHQKDDFLETALMQQRSNRTPFLYGIKIDGNLLSMNIFRPMLYLWWKKEIIDLCNKNSLLFATDSTNEMPIYTRNKIRLELNTITIAEKQKKFTEFIDLNNENDNFVFLVEKFYDEWEKNNFDCDMFKKLVSRDMQQSIVFLLITKNYKNINLTSKKLFSIVDFVCSKNRTAIYKLNSTNKLFKKKNKLFFSSFSPIV